MFTSGHLAMGFAIKDETDQTALRDVVENQMGLEVPEYYARRWPSSPAPTWVGGKSPLVDFIIKLTRAQESAGD